MTSENKEERYQIIKVRNGCWRLETESGFISEHSTQQGAEKMLLQIQNKSTPQEEKVEVTEHQDGTIRANGIQIVPSPRIDWCGACKSEHGYDCPLDTPQTPSWEVKFDKEKARHEAQLAVFIDFVDDEAKRIDEERRGAIRRDGGRIMACSIFLKQFLDAVNSQAKQEGRREGIEEAILEIIYGCARYTNMHQDTDDVNVAVNTVRADVLSKLDKKRK